MSAFLLAPLTIVVFSLTIPFSTAALKANLLRLENECTRPACRTAAAHRVRYDPSASLENRRTFSSLEVTFLEFFFRQKRINGPPPQPSLPAVRHAVPWPKRITEASAAPRRHRSLCRLHGRH